MADPKESLKKKIAELKDQLAKNKAAGKDLKRDPACRQLRKTLKRTQRKLRLLSPLPFAEQQPGDQEARDDEEDVDPDEAARHPETSVVEDDERDGKAAQPFDVGAVGRAGSVA